MNEVLKFDLGGTRKRTLPGFKIVNLVGDCDVHADITDLDKFAEDNTVDEFYLSHTLEHIPILKYHQFLLDMKRKLKVGGKIRVTQSDAESVIKMWVNGELTFRSMRGILFPPANRAEISTLLQHQSMWSEEELIKDFEAIGMIAENYDAGSWKFDVDDDIIPNATREDFGKRIKNLGVIAVKQCKERN